MRFGIIVLYTGGLLSAAAILVDLETSVKSYYRSLAVYIDVKLKICFGKKLSMMFLQSVEELERSAII